MRARSLMHSPYFIICTKERKHAGKASAEKGTEKKKKRDDTNGPVVGLHFLSYCPVPHASLKNVPECHATKAAAAS